MKHVAPALALATLTLAIAATGCSRSADSTARASAATAPSADPLETTGTDSVAPAAPSTPVFARPASDRVEPFDGSSLIAAFRAQPGASVNQADALEFALFSAQTGLQCDAVKSDFASEFATHRSIASYVLRLAAHGGPMPLSSVDLPTTLGQYDFNGGRFQMGPNYGDGSRTFEFNYTHNCQTAWSTMPDVSTAYPEVDLEVENAAPLHVYNVSARQAESIAQGEYQSTFTEHLVFYPLTIARRDGGGLGAIVHVTKVALERRPAGAPANVVPTVLMTRNLP